MPLYGLVGEAERGDDHLVANAASARRRAVQADNSASALGRDGVGLQALAVGNVPDMNEFTVDYPRRIQQVFTTVMLPTYSTSHPVTVALCILLLHKAINFMVLLLYQIGVCIERVVGQWESNVRPTDPR